MFQVVCERSDVFASGCAVARAYPMYSRKTPMTGPAPSTPPTVSVHFLLVSEESATLEAPLSAAELKCLQTAAHGVRLAAKIVDMPCSEMNVAHFVAVRT